MSDQPIIDPRTLSVVYTENLPRLGTAAGVTSITFLSVGYCRWKMIIMMQYHATVAAHVIRYPDDYDLTSFEPLDYSDDGEGQEFLQRISKNTRLQEYGFDFLVGAMPDLDKCSAEWYRLRTLGDAAHFNRMWGYE